MNCINVDEPKSVPSLPFSADEMEHSNLCQQKILIVDDEKFNTDIIYGFLMMLGMVNRKQLSSFAYNGSEAVHEIQIALEDNDPNRFGLILMDSNMPFLDGYEASRQIRSLFS